MTMNRSAHDKLGNWFKNRLKEGAFPEVEYEEGERMCKYNMMAYSHRWARAAKVLDEKMRVINPSFSVLSTRLRSKSYQQVLETAISSLTISEVEQEGERFRTWFE